MSPKLRYLTPLAALLMAGNVAANSAAIDINQADASALQSLTGVGPATAAAIIEDREQNGPYPTVDALMRVNGIGEATLEAVRERIELK